MSSYTPYLQYLTSNGAKLLGLAGMHFILFNKFLTFTININAKKSSGSS